MNLSEQNLAAGEFFSNCMKLLNRKGRDYTTDGDAFKNTLTIAEEVGISPEKVIWIYLRKHLSAIQRYILSESLESEPIEGRLQDAVNYLALLHVLIKCKKPKP